MIYDPLGYLLAVPDDDDDVEPLSTARPAPVGERPWIDVQYPGQMGHGVPYTPQGVDEYRAFVATADVNLCADWDTFRAQLARLEERIEAAAQAPDKPTPPPVCSPYWVPLS